MRQWRLHCSPLTGARPSNERATDRLRTTSATPARSEGSPRAAPQSRRCKRSANRWRDAVQVNEPRVSDRPVVAIMDGRADFADAIRHGDTRTAASIYTDTARLIAPSAELIEGRESIEAFWQAGVDAGVVDVELDTVAQRRADRMAYEVGRYVLQLRPAAGQMVVDRGTYVLVLEQQADGSWRRAVEMFSPAARPVDWTKGEEQR